MRAEIFQTNLNQILAHNGDTPRRSWTMGMNQFGAMSSSEFKQFYRGYSGPNANTAETVPTADLSGHVAVNQLPAEVDWRNQKVVTPVKNQGGCGSCWAFSTAETLGSP